MFTSNQSTSPGPASSPRASAVRRWFGIFPLSENEECRGAAAPIPAEAVRALLPRPGRITLITGPSGAGKSTLLRALHRETPTDCAWMDVNAQDLPDRPLVDCFEEVALADALRLLSRVGLAEARTWLRPPSALSEGERWRLRLALALAGATATRDAPGPRELFLVCDEFAAMLDRVTARIVARCLRRLTAGPLRAILATSHDDLGRALRPDTVVRCDFGSVEIDWKASCPEGRAAGHVASQP